MLHTAFESSAYLLHFTEEENYKLL